MAKERLAAAAFVAAISLPGLGLAVSCSSDSDDDARPAFSNPPEVTSSNGLLATTLEAKATTYEIGGRRFTTWVYNGLYTPPVLRVKPGDVIELRLVNGTTQHTNLHYHGLNVSPRGNGDNVFLHIEPGEQFDYRIEISPTHPTGLFWYHPHGHGNSEFQTFNGMSGGLIVEGLLDPFPPELQGIEERILLLKDIQQAASGEGVPDDIDSNAPTQRTVNGLVNPTMTIRPGETQLWRVANVGPDIYYRLSLDGHVLHEIARDGNRHTEIVSRDEIVLPPSSRVEFLVQGGPPGEYLFRTLEFDTGPQGDQYPEVTLATLVSEGTAETPAVLPTTLPPVPDLRDAPVSRRRTFVFSENEDGTSFFINGRAFDPNRTDTTVRLGDVEEWEIVNDSEELHVFHIHQLDFQVVESEGTPVPFTGYQDTVNLPFGASVKILVPFTNPVILGRFVYHCHIMAHEDNGMMAVIEVVP